MPWGLCGSLGRVPEPVAFTRLGNPDSDLPLVMTLEVCWSKVSFGHADSVNGSLSK